MKKDKQKSRKKRYGKIDRHLKADAHPDHCCDETAQITGNEEVDSHLKAQKSKSEEKIDRQIKAQKKGRKESKAPPVMPRPGI